MSVENISVIIFGGHPVSIPICHDGRNQGFRNIFCNQCVNWSVGMRDVPVNKRALIKIGAISALGSIVVWCGWVIDQRNPSHFVDLIRNEGAGGLATIWTALEIPSDLELTNTDRRLDVKIIPVPTGLGAPACEIVMVTDNFRLDWQGLVFVRDWGVWRYIGNVDLPCQKYEEPTLRFVVVAPGQYCMAIRSLSASGTGLLNYEEVWLEWADGRIREVLRIPVAGHVVGWGLPFDRVFSAQGVDERGSNGVFSVLVDIHEAFFQPDHVDDLASGFSEEHKIAFEWNSTARSFRINTGRSDMTLPELRGVWEDGAAEFAARHWESLRKILESGTHGMRKWCMDILAEAVGRGGAWPGWERDFKDDEGAG